MKHPKLRPHGTVGHQMEKENSHPKGSKFLRIFLLWRLTKEDLYGYMLIDELNDLGIASIKQSTVYTLLSKMEELGFVKSEQKFVDNRPRRIYSITSKGRKFFEDVKRNKISGKLKEFIKDLAQ